MKREFTVEEVIDIVKSSKYFNDLPLVEAIQVRNDIFDLKEMPRYIEKVFLDEDLFFDGHINRWCAKYNEAYCKRFGLSEEERNDCLVLPLWINNILSDYVSELEECCND